MLATEQQAPRLDWRVWLLWIAASAIGFGVSVSFVSFISMLPNVSTLVISCVGGAFAGLVLGLAQWLILRKLVIDSGWWILATVAGSTLGSPLGTLARSIVGSFTSDLIGAVLGSAVIGLVFGTLQWLVLRRQFTGSSLWIWASMAGNAAATPVGWIFNFEGIVLFAVTGAVFGAVTGIVLARLVQQSKQSTVPLAS